MDLVHVAAALLSALLHAGWNAAVKSSPRPTETMAAQMLLSALIMIPGFAWTGFPAAASWPWIIASTTLNMVAVLTMLRAYKLAGFGIVYPVIRAVSLMLVVPLSAAVAGDNLTATSIAGIALVASALGILATSAGRGTAFPRAALFWTLASGLTLAVYVMCDVRGVRASGSALAYGFAASLANGIAMTWRQRHLGSPLTLVAKWWKVALPAAIASAASYLLILWVWSVAPAAPAAALRDTSAIFAILIAVVWLREPFTRVRLLAVVLAAIAVPLLRLG